MDINIRNAHPAEFDKAGRLMYDAYSQLDGFPKPKDQPAYYEMLLNVGKFCSKPETKLFIATDSERLHGAVVYFNDMQYYGSGGMATKELHAAGFRLLAVDPAARGRGIGKMLTLACVEEARKNLKKSVIIHTTEAMRIAWQMYETLGFKRAPKLDFVQGNLSVYGLRYNFHEH